MTPRKSPETNSLSHPLRWFPELLELSRKRLRPQARLLGLSLVVGVIAGLGAILFFAACQVVFHFSLDGIVGYHPTSPGGEPALFPESTESLHPLLLLLVPTVGGILSGFIVYTFAPEAEGHGTDAAIHAYHHQGQIPPRVALVKIIASALTLGTGGSGGREGPIAQIGASFGSFLGTILRLKPAERRILLAAGMGAGVAAIFRAPLAGALFAAEVLYHSPDFESEVIIPAGLASVMAYCTFGFAFGWKSLFLPPPALLEVLTFTQPLHLISYTVLALFLVVLAMLFTRSFYALTSVFHELKLPPHFKPAIGAFLTGGVGVSLYFLFGENKEVLSVMSAGYGALQDVLSAPQSGNNLYFGAVLLAIAFGKIVTTGLTIGSGGSGGVFGPSMVIGGCGGGALGIFAHWVWPEMVPHPACFVLVGMAGFFAAAAKTPFSTLVMVSELTGNYNLLLPTLWVCALTFLLSDGQSIYSSQVESRSRSPAHQGDYIRDVLTGLTVEQFLLPKQELMLVHPEDRLARVLELVAKAPYTTLPVINAEGGLMGIVTLTQVHLASQLPNVKTMIVAADLMRSDVVPLHRNDPLDQALELFVDNDLLELPVIDDTPQKQVIGIVRRADVSSTYLQHVHGIINRKELTVKEDFQGT